MAEKENPRFPEVIGGMLETLLCAAAESILLIDGAGRILWLNRRSEAIFGYDEGELTGQPVEVLVPEARRAAHTRHRTEYLVDPRNRPMGAGLDLTGRRRDGSEFPIEISLSYAGAGDDIRIMALVSDISRRKVLEEEVRRAQKAERERQEARIRRLEREREVLRRLSQPPPATLTSGMYGLKPLRESAGGPFRQIVAEYGRIMELAMEMRIYKMEHDIPESLRRLAVWLGNLEAEPRDVVEVHTTALRNCSEQATEGKVRAYVEEGQLLLIELMGNLAAFYRQRIFREAREYQ